MDLGNGYGHLTYSTLVHPGDSWAEMKNRLQQFVPEVKKRVSPDKPFGVSLRLANASVETLMAQPEERAWLPDRHAVVGRVRAAGDLVDEHPAASVVHDG